MMCNELAGVEVPAARTSAGTSRGVSARGSSYAAASRIAMSSPCSERWCRAARSFSRFTISSGAFLIEIQWHPKIL
jgi:hypothetical protein